MTVLLLGFDCTVDIQNSIFIKVLLGCLLLVHSMGDVWFETVWYCLLWDCLVCSVGYYLLQFFLLNIYMDFLSPCTYHVRCNRRWSVGIIPDNSKICEQRLFVNANQDIKTCLPVMCGHDKEINFFAFGVWATLGSAGGDVIGSKSRFGGNCQTQNGSNL